MLALRALSSPGRVPLPSRRGPFTAQSKISRGGLCSAATFWALGPSQHSLKPTLSDRDAASFCGAIGAALLTAQTTNVSAVRSDVRQSAAAGTASRQIWDMLPFSGVPDELRDADTPCRDWANLPWPASTRNRERWSQPLTCCHAATTTATRHFRSLVAAEDRRQRSGTSRAKIQPSQPRVPSVHPIHLSHLRFVFLRDGIGRWSRTAAGSRIENHSS